MSDLEEKGTPAEGSAPPRQTPFKPSNAAAPATPPPAAAAQAAPPPAAVPVAQPAASPTAPFSPITRRPTLRRPGEAPAAVPAAEPAAAAPETSSAIPAGVPITHAEASKRKTTRVDLPLAAGMAGVTDDTTEFKTVKLRPIPPPHPGSSPFPDGPKPLSPSQVQAAKSKTSRISLEAALGTNEVLDSGVPKTIRLKRPSEITPGVATPNAVPAAMVVVARKTGLVPPQAGAAQKTSTAKLPTQSLPPEVAAPAADDDTTSPTRRKTIKIKRPTAATGIKLAVGQAEGEQAGEGEMQQLALPAGMRPVGVPDTANPVFIVVAVASLLLTLGLIWILAAQTFGPNAAITGYTSMKGPDIAPPPGLVSIQ